MVESLAHGVEQNEDEILSVELVLFGTYQE
jgi:hypothetical protein